MENKLSQFDLSRIVGIESIWHPGTTDPWSALLMPEFIDVVIYSDQARCVVPIASNAKGEPDPESIPTLIHRINMESGRVLNLDICTFDEHEVLNPDYLADTFKLFAQWVRANKSNFRLWLALHREPWIERGHDCRVGGRYVFDIERLAMNRSFNELLYFLKVSKEDLLYGFDMLLRYFPYGRHCKGASYFSHPIRT